MHTGWRGLAKQSYRAQPEDRHILSRLFKTEEQRIVETTEQGKVAVELQDESGYMKHRSK